MASTQDKRRFDRFVAVLEELILMLQHGTSIPSFRRAVAELMRLADDIKVRAYPVFETEEGPGGKWRNTIIYWNTPRGGSIGAARIKTQLMMAGEPIMLDRELSADEIRECHAALVQWHHAATRGKLPLMKAKKPLGRHRTRTAMPGARKKYSWQQTIDLVERYIEWRRKNPGEKQSKFDTAMKLGINGTKKALNRVREIRCAFEALALSESEFEEKRRLPEGAVAQAKDVGRRLKRA